MRMGGRDLPSTSLVPSLSAPVLFLRVVVPAQGQARACTNVVLILCRGFCNKEDYEIVKNVEVQNRKVNKN